MVISTLPIPSSQAALLLSTPARPLPLQRARSLMLDRLPTETPTVPSQRSQSHMWPLAKMWHQPQRLTEVTDGGEGRREEGGSCHVDVCVCARCA